MADLAVKSDPTEDRLAALTMPSCGAWGRAVREAALARLRSMGLPGRRDEYWKYTRPDTLTQANVVPAAVFQNDELPPFEGLERLKLVFVDGVFDADASDDLAETGLEIERLETAMAQDIHWAKDLYGVLETNGQTPVARPLAALNSAYASDGIVLRVTAPVARPISMIYRHENP
ncbi:MAG: Fe-S cluster assembly protein SufD, partial [Lutimaribacter sp.]